MLDLSTIIIADHVVDNVPSYNTDVHYRLYFDSEDGPIAICVQDFDYRDYESQRFMTEESYDSREEALRRLNELLTARVQDPSFESEARTAAILAGAGAPLTRRQALDAYLSRGLA